MLGKNRLSLGVPALALALAFLPAVAQAAPAREALRSARPGSRVLATFSAMVDWVGSVFDSIGVGIDPNGGGGDGSGPGPGDGGDSTDPLPPMIDSDAGSFLDPNGTEPD
jgi:hypothetical protein